MHVCRANTIRRILSVRINVHHNQEKEINEGISHTNSLFWINVIIEEDIIVAEKYLLRRFLGDPYTPSEICGSVHTVIISCLK